MENSKKPIIMGILNVTPDSFSDGGKFLNIQAAIAHAKKMVEDGADIIDVGGESTRPNSEPVSVEEELERAIPVIEKLKEELDVPISIDTCKPKVAEAALKAGASIVNDITALESDEMAKVAAKHHATVVIMHMQGNPKTMQKKPHYKNIVGEVKGFLKKRIAKAKKFGIKKIIIDPGIGFGKTVEHNLELIAKLSEFKSLGCPVMIGASRKSFIGKILNEPVENRLEGTIIVNSIALMNGADILRVHDVKEARQAIQMVEAVKKFGNKMK